jgi:hypothetical protein
MKNWDILRRVRAHCDKRNAEIKAAEESMRAERIAEHKRIETESVQSMRVDSVDPPFTDKENLEYWAEGIFKAYENNPPKMTTEQGRVAALIINVAITEIQTTINSL